MWRISSPLLNNKTVFNKGTAKGSKATIPIGGHVVPIEISGAKLEWKKAQKTLKKANTSLTTKSTKPIVKPLLT